MRRHHRRPLHGFLVPIPILAAVTANHTMHVADGEGKKLMEQQRFQPGDQSTRDGMAQTAKKKVLVPRARNKDVRNTLTTTSQLDC